MRACIGRRGIVSCGGFLKILRGIQEASWAAESPIVETMRPWVRRCILEKLALASHICAGPYGLQQHLVRSMLSVDPHHGRRRSGSGLAGKANQKLPAILLHSTLRSKSCNSRLLGKEKEGRFRLSAVGRFEVSGTA